MSRRVGGGCTTRTCPAAPVPEWEGEWEGELEGAATVALKCGFVLHMCV